MSLHCADLTTGSQRTRRYKVVVNAGRKIHSDHLRAIDYNDCR